MTFDGYCGPVGIIFFLFCAMHDPLPEKPIFSYIFSYFNSRTISFKWKTIMHFLIFFLHKHPFIPYILLNAPRKGRKTKHAKHAKKMHENDISYKCIGVAIEIHKSIGPGLLESAYENAMAYDLKQMDFNVRQQVPMPFIYKHRFSCTFPAPNFSG